MFISLVSYVKFAKITHLALGFHIVRPVLLYATNQKRYTGKELLGSPTVVKCSEKSLIFRACAKNQSYGTIILLTNHRTKGAKISRNKYPYQEMKIYWFVQQDGSSVVFFRFILSVSDTQRKYHVLRWRRRGMWVILTNFTRGTNGNWCRKLFSCP